MTASHANPALLTRRSTLGLLLAGLAGNAVAPQLVKTVEVAATAAAPAIKKLAAPTQSWPSLDALGQAMVDKKLTPGLSLSVMHAGALLYSKGFGLANVDSSTAVTPQTEFRIASITKQFTAASILLLAEDGLLTLDDPLLKFMPEFPRAADITLRQLLSHTSGMGDYINGQSMDVLTQAQTRDYTTDELVKIISARQPLYRAQPGATWLYSNSAFTILGIVVEKLSGMAFADFAFKRLFTPAGLTQTSIDKTCTVASVCNGYRPNYKAPTKFDTVLPVSASFAGGAGAIRSTTEDLSLWHHALLEGKVLKPQSLRAMLTPTLLKNGTPAYERRGNDPMEYGLGQGLGSMNNLKLASHGGRINGFTGHLRSFTDQKLTVAILYNSDGGGAPGFAAAQKGLKTEASRLGLEYLGLSKG
ncbi:serine hydrolase domain-containing protein [Asticcacaulis sp. 201]|uniref:serine hydrolase domain-containing protein n=1 Tax=Asticcacaulis sp. 201 TaxID=3028787 RepID=UPI0029168F64|nr:serine hydrolase domain-containing protein [Asticcacaulis sp. 201]MDV6332924.1 serine hydrolase domain-containing protein [Asticcacaulis sp. 201]